ncbi:hypothetical protein K7432_007132 [Basidiobolus ranarum]|uniref:Uncharacterized protein n=1 Tax=Basidiobolus ranarum TaxID=34480 RepID=A0ABR2WTU5_9FUNG
MVVSCIFAVVSWLVNGFAKCWTATLLLIQTALVALFGISTVQRFYKYFDYLFLLNTRNTGKIRRSQYSAVTSPVNNTVAPSETEVDYLLTLIWIPHQFLIYLIDFFALHFIYQEFLRGYKLAKEISMLIRELVARPNNTNTASLKPTLAVEFDTPEDDVVPSDEREVRSFSTNEIIESIEGPIRSPFSELFIPPVRSDLLHQVNSTKESRKRKPSLLSRLSPKPGKPFQTFKMKKFLGRLSLRNKPRN